MMASNETSEVLNNDDATVSSGIRLEDLFDHSRIQVWPVFYKAILYLPFALFLLIVRVVAGALGVIVISLLPRTSQKRSSVLKRICKILGIIIEVDDKYSDENAKLLIANHVSIWDRLAVNFMVPCLSISKDFKSENDPLAFWKDIDIVQTRDLNNSQILALENYISSSSMPVLHFPEYASTNGKVGLLEFQPALFSLNSTVQPVLIRVSMSSFITISPSVLGSSVWSDMFWTFTIPSTFFTLKTLPSMARLPEESAIDFSKRVQIAMADALTISPTVHTSSDKAELVKRSQVADSSRVSNRSMTSRECDTGPGIATSSSAQQLLSQHPHQFTLNTAAATFGKSPKERMLSFKERKAALLEIAKLNYLQKQASKDSPS